MFVIATGEQYIFKDNFSGVVAIAKKNQFGGGIGH